MGGRRVNWPQTLARITAAGSTPAAVFLFPLPDAGRQLLLAIFDYLEWRATFRTADYDYADWDSLQAIIANTKEGLMANSTLRAMTDELILYSDVCCLVESGAPVIEPPISEEEPGGGAGSAWRDDLCKQAQAAHDGGKVFLEQASAYLNGGQAISMGIISAILTTALIPGMLPVSLIAGIVVALIAFVVAGTSGDMVDDWAALKPAIVCAIFQAATPAGAHAEVHAVIAAAGHSAITTGLFSNIYNQQAINEIWALAYDSTGYSEAYCEDCEQDYAADYTVVYDWTNGGDLLGWGASGAGQALVEVLGRGALRTTGGQVYNNSNGVEAFGGLPAGVYKIVAARIKYLWHDVDADMANWILSFMINGVVAFNVQATGQAKNVWLKHDDSALPDELLGTSGTSLMLDFDKSGQSAGLKGFAVDSVTLWMNGPIV